MRKSIMTLEIQLPPDVEAFYAAEASAKGVPLERHIIEQLIARASTINGQKGAPKSQIRRLNLPQLRGTVTGSLRREDIYDGRG
jgi:hypothetical protein